MAFTNELIAKIKSSNKLEDIVSKYVNNLSYNSSSPWIVGHCPFHEEKDDSFKINKKTQTWHCYGCKKGSKDDGNKGSDIIAFVQEIEDVGFEQALTMLAKEANIEITKEEEDPKIKAEKVLKTNLNKQYYLNLWNQNNEQSVLALNYLRDRGLTDETIKKWRLGLVPLDEISRRTDITDIAGKISFPMIEVSNTEKQATLSMAYRSPFSNYSGCKYKNDHNTIAFTKGDFLYGMNFAMNNIKGKGYGIVSECYFSTLMMHQVGFDNTVSIMGTSLKSEKRISMMKRYSKNWVLMLDNDSAGMKGMLLALPLLLKEGLNVDIVELPYTLDPDELILKLEKDKFIQWFNENRKSFIDLVINNKLNEYEEKTSKLKEGVLNSVNNLIDCLEQPKLDLYRSMINRRLGV